MRPHTTARENSRKQRRTFRRRSGPAQMARRLTSGSACLTKCWRISRQSNEGGRTGAQLPGVPPGTVRLSGRLRRLLKVRVAPGGGHFCAPYRNPIRSTPACAVASNRHGAKAHPRRLAWADCSSPHRERYTTLPSCLSRLGCPGPRFQPWGALWLERFGRPRSPLPKLPQHVLFLNALDR